MRMKHSCRSIALLMILATPSLCAQAGPPFQTDDPDLLTLAITKRTSSERLMERRTKLTPPLRHLSSTGAPFPMCSFMQFFPSVAQSWIRGWCGCGGEPRLMRISERSQRICKTSLSRFDPDLEQYGAMSNGSDGAGHSLWVTTAGGKLWRWG
jgi:hypothetical protein